MAKTCVICEAPLAGRQRKLCSEKCKKRRAADQMTASMREYRARTGERYSSKYETKPYVVAAKAARGRRRNQEVPMRERYPAQFAAKDARRRMRVKDATVETFDPADVFERDGWVCQLCGGRVDSALAYPEPLSKSLDHRVPIARGGEHSMVNTQLSHLSCNVRKRDRVEGVPDGF